MLYCVIPAYRAAATVNDVVSRALEYADAVVVVDDGCPQQSGAAVQAAYAGNASVSVLIRERNGGVGAAMKTGIAFCIERGADVIVKLDAVPEATVDPGE